MPSPATIAIHPSQFPDRVRLDLLSSLRSRQVNHKFHYDSLKQTQQWLALHQALSPARNDPDCARIYSRSFKAAARQLRKGRVHVIGLGCGGGQKDTRLLRILKSGGIQVAYTPCDVSTAMVLVARQTALAVVPEGNCSPLVCDLATATDLNEVVRILIPSGTARLLTFFGMIPNFEPRVILPRLAALLRPGDTLLFSANLAPGDNYSEGLKFILPQYDNPPTREWLMTFLLDLGIQDRDGKILFRIEPDPAGSGASRVAAHFRFSRKCRIQVASEVFNFGPSDSIRLFFSYRYTPALVRRLLGRHGLQVKQEWITRSGEEGVFLCARESK